MELQANIDWKKPTVRFPDLYGCFAREDSPAKLRCDGEGNEGRAA